MAIVDASVVVALVQAHEEAHPAAWGWLRRAHLAGEILRSPVVVLAEVGSALGRGLYDPDLAHRIVGQIQRSNLLELLPVTPILARSAAAIAVDHRIRGCDALYVALAQERHEPLVTLDEEQRRRGAAVVETLKPKA